MPPDFSKKTVDTLAKRAAYICSNPDCRARTVGPNSASDKATIVGEAAHVYGARPNSKRYNSNMSNESRADITNGIWLCRNCHKLIDSDQNLFTAELLFSWREHHERYALAELGSSTDKILSEQQEDMLQPFKHYPPKVRRIIIDKPSGWEFSLTSELMRHLHTPVIRKLQDLEQGLYVRVGESVTEADAFRWVNKCLEDCSRLITPIDGLLKKMNESWGKPGHSGNVSDIHHVVILMRNHLASALELEEQIYFTHVPEDFKKLQDLLKSVTSSQLQKLKCIPNDLDHIVEQLRQREREGGNEQITLKRTISIELPKSWTQDFSRELKRVSRLQDSSIEDSSPESSNSGCLSAITFGVIAWLLWLIFF